MTDKKDVPEFWCAFDVDNHTQWGFGATPREALRDAIDNISTDGPDLGAEYDWMIHGTSALFKISLRAAKCDPLLVDYVEQETYDGVNIDAVEGDNIKLSQDVLDWIENYKKDNEVDE